MKSSLLMTFGCLVAGAFVAVQGKKSGNLKEYVAMVPNAVSGEQGTLRWVKVEYNPSKSSASDVNLTLVDEGTDKAGVKILGNWFDYDPVGDDESMSLTAKIEGKNLYSLVDSPTYATENNQVLDSDTWSLGGCCGNVVRVQGKRGRFNTRDINILPLVQQAMGTNASAPSHTFYVDDNVGYFVTYYREERLGSMVFGSAIVAVDLETEEIVNTKDGKSAFLFYDAFGTLSTDETETIFKVPYYQTNSTRSVEQYHCNGIQIFKTKDGQSVMALTHFSQKEAFIVLNPYKYSSSRGGGNIMQRFGTPKLDPSNRQSDTRRFGLDTAEESFDAVHNVFYHRNSYTFNGEESISLFVNKQGDYSRAFEFVLKLVDQTELPESSYDDTIFDTQYVAANASFATSTQGGARSIGNGVFIISSGGDTTFQGFEIVDINGGQQQIAYESSSDAIVNSQPGFYDPFVLLKR